MPAILPAPDRASLQATPAYSYRAGSNAGGRAAASQPDSLQDHLQRAEMREPALEQVGADEGGEPQPVRAVKQRARFDAQGEGHQDKDSRENADCAFSGHDDLLSVWVRMP